jgi:hypothetical protein
MTILNEINSYITSRIRLILLKIVVIYLHFNPILSYSQVSLTATSGTITGSFSTLKDAFDAINAGTHQGSIAIEINSNTSESLTASLNASGSGSASYSSIGISQSGGATRTISGNIAGPLINLNGADNVTIDGLNTGGNSLTISNTSTFTSATTSTIRFIEGATSNTITNCTILGSTLNTTSGLVFFSTSTISGGNSNNSIFNNSFSNAAGNRPINVIFSSGTSTNINVNNTISDCHFFNFMHLSSSSFGINLGSNTSQYTLSGNSFYETNATTTTGAGEFRAININNTNGNEFTITGNFIGGSQALCGGSAWSKSGNNNIFYGISLTVGSTTASNVQGNTISNFSWTNSGNASWYGIGLNSGLINVGTTTGNTIGASTGTGNITFTGGATGANFYGIYVLNANINCQKNTIASITVASSNTANASNFWGIVKTGNSNIVISNNHYYLPRLVMLNGMKIVNYNLQTLLTSNCTWGNHFKNSTISFV